MVAECEYKGQFSALRDDAKLYVGRMKTCLLRECGLGRNVGAWVGTKGALAGAQIFIPASKTFFIWSQPWLTHPSPASRFVLYNARLKWPHAAPSFVVVQVSFIGGGVPITDRILGVAAMPVVASNCMLERKGRQNCIGFGARCKIQV